MRAGKIMVVSIPNLIRLIVNRVLDGAKAFNQKRRHLCGALSPHLHGAQTCVAQSDGLFPLLFFFFCRVPALASDRQVLSPCSQLASHMLIKPSIEISPTLKGQIKSAPE